MKYRIFRDGAEANTIVASEEFCAAYCQKRGYTFEAIVEKTKHEEPEREPTEMERLRADIDFLMAMGGYTE